MTAAGLLAGCAELPTPGPLTKSPETGDGLTVTVIDRGWHTDIALPAAAISGPLAGLKRPFPGVRFLVFGFGDRAYYMAPDEPFAAMVAAQFPGPSVILVTALRAPPAEAFGADHAVTLRLSPGQFDAIVAFLRKSLAMDADGAMQELGGGPYPGSEFYASGEPYDAFHNCNHWTVAVLRGGGLPVDPDGVILARQVMARVRRLDQ